MMVQPAVERGLHALQAEQPSAPDQDGILMTATTGPQAVRLDVHDAVATITLDSPANRNALSAQLRTELAHCLDRALTDEAVRVVVLTHSGPVFCAGADLKESRSGAAATGTDLPSILHAVWTSPKPVVTRLAGGARAGGLGLLAACDLRIAADDVTFSFTEVRLGVVPAVISCTVLPRMVPHAASELFLTGEVFSARRAADVGLLTAAVPAPALDDEVDRNIGMLLRGAPSALAGTKQMLRAQRPVDLLEDLEAQAVVSAHHFTSEEGREGMLAFAEKREPSWVVDAPRRS